MKLKTILEVHHRFESDPSLKDNFGDGYLFEHNRIFRNIRKATIQAGLRFSPERFHHYEAMPLTQLPKILETGIVPYVPNVKILDEIEQTRPGLFELGDLAPLKANYIHHESAHGLARMIRKKWIKDQTARTLQTNRLQALSIMLEEGFANACESLLCLDAGEFIHQEFLLKNTYIVERASVRKAYRTAMEWIGERAFYKLLTLSFLHANLLKDSLKIKDFERVLQFCIQDPAKKLSQDQVRRLMSVFTESFDLDPVFTIKTNRFCLRLMGIDSDLKVLYDFDLMKILENDQGYSKCLDQMADVLCGGRPDVRF